MDTRSSKRQRTILPAPQQGPINIQPRQDVASPSALFPIPDDWDPFAPGYSNVGVEPSTSEREEDGGTSDDVEYEFLHRGAVGGIGDAIEYALNQGVAAGIDDDIEYQISYQGATVGLGDGIEYAGAVQISNQGAAKRNLLDFSNINPPLIPTMDVVGDLGDYIASTQNMDAGLNSHYQVRRRLNIPNDNFMDMSSSNTMCINTVYTAMFTKPADDQMNANQHNNVILLDKKLKALGADADQHLADISSMIVAAIYRLHAQGDNLYPAQLHVLKPRPEDFTMKASQRLNAINNILFNHKKHVIDVMDGLDAVTKFVAAPFGAAKRKESYKDNNSSRAENHRNLVALHQATLDESEQGTKKGKKKGTKCGPAQDDDDA